MDIVEDKAAIRDEIGQAVAAFLKSGGKVDRQPIQVLAGARQEMENEMPHGIYPKDLADQLKNEAGKPYRPSNGTEGDIFEHAYCIDCELYPVCEIPDATMFYDEDDPEYPVQWQYGTDGQPTCTAFVPAKLENEGNSDE